MTFPDSVRELRSQGKLLHPKLEGLTADRENHSLLEEKAQEQSRGREAKTVIDELSEAQ